MRRDAAATGYAAPAFYRPTLCHCSGAAWNRTTDYCLHYHSHGERALAASPLVDRETSGQAAECCGGGCYRGAWRQDAGGAPPAIVPDEKRATIPLARR